MLRSVAVPLAVSGFAAAFLSVIPRRGRVPLCGATLPTHQRAGKSDAVDPKLTFLLALSAGWGAVGACGP